MGPINQTLFAAFPSASLTPPSPGQHYKRRQADDAADTDQMEEEGADDAGPSNPPSNLALGGPIDEHTQRTHDRLDYLIRQNQYLIQSHHAQNQHYNDFLAQQNEYGRVHIEELNALVTRWTMSSADENYFTPPPQFNPYNPPPPPPPY